MKQEVVRNFLGLQGITGIALMDGRSRPYFCGVDQTLNFQQKEALAQGIRQVIETTPEDFESFEFQFTGNQVYIYKLAHGIILLVLADHTLVYATYQQALENLKSALQEDLTKAIATFRLIASDLTTITGGQSFKAKNGLVTGNTPVVDRNNGVTAPPSTPPTVAPPEPASPVSDEATVELKDLLAALNHLSQFTTQYLGTAVITNYWKSTRPDDVWLQNFQVDRAAKVTLTNPSMLGNQKVTTAQHQMLRDWVQVFIKRCSQVIRDFPNLVEQHALDDQQRQLLL